MKTTTVHFVSEFESDTLTKFTLELEQTRVTGRVYGRVTHAGELVHVTGVHSCGDEVIGQALEMFHGTLLDEAGSKVCRSAYSATQRGNPEE